MIISKGDLFVGKGIGVRPDLHVIVQHFNVNTKKVYYRHLGVGVKNTTASRLEDQFLDLFELVF